MLTAVGCHKAAWRSEAGLCCNPGAVLDYGPVEGPQYDAKRDYWILRIRMPPFPFSLEAGAQVSVVSSELPRGRMHMGLSCESTGHPA